jgi:hypothetical protein
MPEERGVHHRMWMWCINELKQYEHYTSKMAPYTPPNTHYSEMDVSSYTDNELYRFIGKNGKRFYWLTKFLELSYIWYDKDRKVIELWGPYSSLQNFQAHHVIGCELDYACGRT